MKHSSRYFCSLTEYVKAVIMSFYDRNVSAATRTAAPSSDTNGMVGKENVLRHFWRVILYKILECCVNNQFFCLISKYQKCSLSVHERRVFIKNFNIKKIVICILFVESSIFGFIKSNKGNKIEIIFVMHLRSRWLFISKIFSKFFRIRSVMFSRQSFFFWYDDKALVYIQYELQTMKAVSSQIHFIKFIIWRLYEPTSGLFKVIHFSLLHGKQV